MTCFYLNNLSFSLRHFFHLCYVLFLHYLNVSLSLYGNIPRPSGVGPVERPKGQKSKTAAG